MKLNGKTIILGITGSIAAYKMANVASELIKLGANVHVIMTKNAAEFISPLVFSTLTGNNCIVDTFDKSVNYSVQHVSLAKKADVVLIAPATANIIGKLANGIADDMLTTTVMACKCHKIIAPAMNTAMYENQAVQDNIEKLVKYNYEIVKPDSGILACRDIGEGKLAKENVLIEYLMKSCACKKDMQGKRVLVTAGPTIEALDPVRYITNHSTGKMGYAIARACMQRGAEVTLVSGKTSIEAPMFVKTIWVTSAEQMLEAVLSVEKENDIIIKAAAVADYRPASVNSEKTKKTDGDSVIELERTVDILATIGKNKKKDQFLCGFSMETENMIENSKKKLEKKNLDMIIANNLKVENAGFGCDTNVITVITKDKTEELKEMSKDQAAMEIIDRILLAIGA